MHPVVLAGLGLDPKLAHTFSKPLAWLAIGALALFLLRSSLVPKGVKLVVTVVLFMAAIGLAEHVGILEAVTGHNADDSDKLIVAIVGTFALWMAFLREERPQRPPGSEQSQLSRILEGRRR